MRAAVRAYHQGVSLLAQDHSLIAFLPVISPPTRDAWPVSAGLVNQ